ncbi:hypothetical protein J6590_000612 [Homalodisca vitripennis]|nr:hypothetical protein J6590_000612 [Homalodisca vitripennis]
MATIDEHVSENKRGEVDCSPRDITVRGSAQTCRLPWGYRGGETLVVDVYFCFNTSSACLWANGRIIME